MTNQNARGFLYRKNRYSTRNTYIYMHINQILYGKIGQINYTLHDIKNIFREIFLVPVVHNGEKQKSPQTSFSNKRFDIREISSEISFSIKMKRL